MEDDAAHHDDDDDDDNEQEHEKKPPPSLLVGIQMWDTPGRERFDAKRQRQRQRPIEDAFLRQADAVMLVYDMTSSTSFTQLLKWFRDLSKLEDRPPILVCANKLDLFASLQQQQNQMRLLSRAKISQKRVEPRGTSRQRLLLPPPTSRTRRTGSFGTIRDVMGLHGQFRGKDIRYEYQVSDEGAAGDRSAQQHGYRRRAGSISASPSTLSMPIYLADRENWTSDGSYLESLLTTEDQSFPDIEMVKLWCLRNGLSHVESSAATGDGVELAFSQLIKIGLKARQRRERQSVPQIAIAAEPQSLPPPAPQPIMVRRNDPIDFSKRYAPKEEPCCLPFLRPLLVLLRRHGDSSI